MRKQPVVEIPLVAAERSRLYRLFEMVPATISYGAFILLIILSLWSPLFAAVYLLLIIMTVLVRATSILYHSIAGHRRLVRSMAVDWSARLADLESPEDVVSVKHGIHKPYGFKAHLENLAHVREFPADYPKPSQLYNAVIVATYNESFEVLEPTIKSIAETSYDNKKFIIILAYEERGGEETEKTARRLEKKFSNTFFEFIIVKHPRDLPDEVVGKGGNITYAARHLQDWLDTKKIAYENVIVTTLDADNRPHASYFDYVTYEYIMNLDRKRLAYQPIALFLNNIWDVPAPMRVVATGNTFWSIITSMRPHMLRNFASHSQSMDALVEMDFWSVRTVVEDGHHYWRSYFHFEGHYSVLPVYVPIYQDAVLDVTLRKTFKAQFIQLRRWMYGASDIAYIAANLFTRKRNVRFWPAFVWFIRALDGYVTAASVSIIVAVGAWVPLLINSQAYRDVVAHQLPDTVSVLQQGALIGLVIMVFQSFKLLPPRPARYKRRRTVFMVLQWGLMPLTAIGYLSAAALNAQGRLFLGRYLTKFDVTSKAIVSDKK